MELKNSSSPIRVTITGAAGQIGSVLCFMIAQGKMFGPDQQVILQLLELPFAETALKGIVMELQDCASPLIADIKPTVNVEEAFDQADVAILVGSKPRGPGMERKDLLIDNAKIFKEQGAAIDKFAKKTIKVLVVGNPANTNALIASHYAQSIPKQNFTSMNRLDQNRAVNLLSQKLITSVTNIHNLIVWGNHSSTMYPDVNHAYLAFEDGKPSVSVRKALNDDDYLNKEFISSVASRGSEIMSVLKRSSVPSTAYAICENMHDWWNGTKLGEFVSMGVITDGNSYGVADGLIFSFPVECKDGQWKIVEGLDIDEFSREKIQATQNDLIEERSTALCI